MTCRVNTFFKAFYLHNPLRLTLDSGAETIMIRETVAKSIGAKICKSSQLSRQADGLTPLKVIGETHLVLSRGGTNLHLDALAFELNGSNDLLVVDYPSAFVEIAKLNNTSSASIVNNLTSIFARHGILQSTSYLLDESEICLPNCAIITLLSNPIGMKVNMMGHVL